jgi:putative SOS response-associated peptidase YedK
MCGRYAILEEEALQDIRDIINQVNKNYTDRVGLVVRGEVAPSQVAPILREDSGKVRLDVMQWGFPRWDNTSGLIINARSESVLEKRMFRQAFLKRRIVIPASGFFEWDHRQPGKRDKYYFSLAGQAVYMAGIYDLFPVDGVLRERFVILTRPAAQPVSELHDRMPLILPKTQIRSWLDPQAAAALLLEQPEPALLRSLC